MAVAKHSLRHRQISRTGAHDKEGDQKREAFAGVRRGDKPMALSIQTPRIYLLIISAISLLAPQEFRHEWRREWEAEIVSRWLLLKKWERLNARSKLDLFKRVRGSFMDVMGFQQSRTTLVLVTLNILVALLTGFGAVKEFVIGGIGDQQIQPFLLSSLAIGVSVLFLISAVAMLRRWVAVRLLVILTGTLSISCTFMARCLRTETWVSSC